MKWQPIETAPKDGTRVDLWADGERVCDAWWNANRGKWMNPQPTTNWGIPVLEDDEATDGDRATHWMPLPEKP